MRAGSAGSLIETLTARKNAIIREWLARTLRTYPELVSRFLSSEEDPFRNPVGHTLREALPGLVDELFGGMDAARLTSLLERVVQIRAVQDYTAGQAVGFLFLLKPILRDALHSPPHPPLSLFPGGEDTQGIPGEGASQPADLAAIESRIDHTALLAFDLYMECRERMYEIREREARRRLGLWLKRQAVEGRTGETENRGSEDTEKGRNGETEKRGNGGEGTGATDSPIRGREEP